MLENKITNFLYELERQNFGKYNIRVNCEKLFEIAPQIYLDDNGHIHDTDHIIHGFTLRDENNTYLMQFANSDQLIAWMLEEHPNISHEQRTKLNQIGHTYSFTTAS